MAFTTEDFNSNSHPFQSSTMEWFGGQVKALLTAGMSGVSESFQLKTGAAFNLQSFTLKPIGVSAADYVKVVGYNAAGEIVYTNQIGIPDNATTTITVNSVVKSIQLIPVTISGGFATEYAGNMQFYVDNVTYDLTLPANSPPQITGAGSSAFPTDEGAAVYPFQSPAVTIVDGDGDTLTVTVRPNQTGTGLFSAMATQNGKIFVENNGVLTFTGSAADATAALRNVFLTNTDFDGLVDTGQSTVLTYTITVDDGRGNVVTNTNAAVTVVAKNEAPTVTATGNIARQTVATVDLVKPFATFVIDDPDNKRVTTSDVAPDTLTARITFPDANGVLTGSGWTKVGASGGVATWQFVGNYQQATAAIQNVQFNPTDTNAPGVVTTNFSISVSDAQFTTNFAGQVSVDATPNVPPVAVADAAAGNEGGTITTLTGGATSVLTNDTDVDGNTLTAKVVTGPANGTLTLNANGTFSYVHNGSESTSDSFTYKANDGTVDSAPVTVTLAITPVDDAPVAVNDTVTFTEDSTANVISVLANDTDVDGGTKQVVSATNGANGTVTVAAGGTGLLYTPKANFFGEDTFTYTLNGGGVGTVKVTVTGVNDAPTITSNGGASAASLSIYEGYTAVTTITARDVDNDVLTFSIASDLASPQNADSRLFSIDPVSGALRFKSGPDFDIPGDANGDNIYRVGVTASDGKEAVTQWLSVSIFDTADGGSSPDPDQGQGPGTAIVGTAFSDKMVSTSANESFDGLGSTDYVQFSGPRAAYTISLGTDGLPSIVRGPDGTDQLVSIERLKFADGVLAFDDGAEQVYRLYEAAFDRAPDLGGLSFWVKEFDNGRGSLGSAATYFLNSPEFVAKYGNVGSLSNLDLVNTLYRNVLNRDGESSGVNYWVGQLEGGMDKARLLTLFSESAENQAGVNPTIVGGVLLDTSVF